ncbi:sugar ABC transporter substrate-binding protein [Pseudobdellovibrio sp. HCB154]|uniref:sugar ABC transporter substrate-binding protein n=1 Tax=Pseudobdellovibrio sp. HCB154 TaxID=3386277 RepID=UPI0039173D49
MKILALLTIVSSLVYTSQAYAKEFRVGVLYWSMNIEGQVAMRKGLEEVAAQINQDLKKSKDHLKLIPYVAGDGAEGVANQIKQMDQMIDKDNVDLIIVQPTDNAALVAPLLKANAKKIPVVAYDQYIVKGEIASYITSNNYQAGYLDGEYLASLFPDDHEMKLVLVEYPKVSSTVERVDGLMDALRTEKQKFKVIGSFEAVEPVGGKKAGADILAKFPNKNSVDAVFTVNDGGGLSVVEAIAKAKRNEIKIATVDGDPRSVKNIKAGLTVIDSAQFCAELGRQSMSVAWKILKGEKYPKKILVPTFPIVKSTVGFYPGWLGKIPNKFEKAWKKGSFWDNQFIEKY